MKKINKILLSCCMLFVFSLIATKNYILGISITNYAPKYAKTTTVINFRATASTTKGKLGTLAKNSPVKILATTGEFYVVQLSSNEIGLISSKYIKTISSAPKGAKTYTMVVKANKTTTDKVVLRGGPGTNFAKRMTLSKNTTVTVIGYISNWYVVITESGNVGCIRKDLLQNTSTSQASNKENTSKVTMSESEQIVFDLINNARKKQGLNSLLAGETLTKLASLKSDDMVNNNYFSHTSKKYGDPFKMLTSYNVSYKVAGENIAGNPSLEDAVNSWLNSSTHKQNILSTSYNYVGIGVTKSDTYGYIIVAMFVGQ